MSYYSESDYDQDAEPSEADAADAHRDGLLVAYADARAALRSLTPETDRTTRWMVLDRVYTTAQALEVERDRAHYGAMNARIVAEMRGAA